MLVMWTPGRWTHVDCWSFRFSCWRSGSVVKHTDLEGMGLIGSSQPSLTPVSGDPMPSSGLFGHQACRWRRDGLADESYKQVF